MRISDWSSDVCSSDLGPTDGKLIRRERPLGGIADPPREHRAAGGFGILRGEKLSAGSRYLRFDGDNVRRRGGAVEYAVFNERLTGFKFLDQEIQHLPLLLSLNDLDPAQHHLTLDATREHILLGERNGSFRQRSEEHTSELQSLLRISYAVFCLQ